MISLPVVAALAVVLLLALAAPRSRRPHGPCDPDWAC